MDSIIAFDKELFKLINGFHSPFFDGVMWVISAKITWIPLYIIVAGFIIKKHKLKAIPLILFAGLAIVFSDQISVHLFKEVFCRYRPSHNPEFESWIHLVNNYKGGNYGFVSNHAANSFAFALFSALIFKLRWYTIAIFAWAFLIGYSRIYLGVHYPADVFVGGLVGLSSALMAWGINKGYNYCYNTSQN